MYVHFHSIFTSLLCTYAHTLRPTMSDTTPCHAHREGEGAYVHSQTAFPTMVTYPSQCTQWKLIQGTGQHVVDGLNVTHELYLGARI